jgi:hypothetical protein
MTVIEASVLIVEQKEGSPMFTRPRDPSCKET